MQVIKGSKRKITLYEWWELLDTHRKRLNESMESFYRFQDVDSIERLEEDATEIIEKCKNIKDCIAFMDKYGIK